MIEEVISFKIVKVPIDQIKGISPFNSRKHFSTDTEEFNLLKESLGSNGNLNPITLDENYLVTKGQRRYLGVLKHNKEATEYNLPLVTELSAIFKIYTSDKEKIIDSLSENTNRQNITDEDLDNTMRLLYNEHHMTFREIAPVAGLSYSQVAKRIKGCDYQTKQHVSYDTKLTPEKPNAEYTKITLPIPEAVFLVLKTKAEQQKKTIPDIVSEGFIEQALMLAKQKGILQ